jgi:hypothetical protein
MTLLILPSHKFARPRSVLLVSFDWESLYVIRTYTRQSLIDFDEVNTILSETAQVFISLKSWKQWLTYERRKHRLAIRRIPSSQAGSPYHCSGIMVHRLDLLIETTEMEIKIMVQAWDVALHVNFLFPEVKEELWGRHSGLTMITAGAVKRQRIFTCLWQLEDVTNRYENCGSRRVQEAKFIFLISVLVFTREVEFLYPARNLPRLHFLAGFWQNITDMSVPHPSMCLSMVFLTNGAKDFVGQEKITERKCQDCYATCTFPNLFTVYV